MIKQYRPTKAEILEKYARKEIHQYLQFDCFVGVEEGDSIVRPDRDGDSMFAGRVDELRSGGIAVRIQILDGTSKKDALRAIKKLLAWAETDYCLLFGEDSIGANIWAENLDGLRQRATPELMEFLDHVRESLRNFTLDGFDGKEQAEAAHTRLGNSLQNVSAILIERLGQDSFEALTR